MWVARYYIKNELKKAGSLTFNASMPHARDHFFLSSVKHPKVVQEFNAFLKNNVGLVGKLKDKYQVRLD